MRSVDLLAMLRPALVYKGTLDHHQIVGRNALVTPSVLTTWRVFDRNVKTPVQMHVDKMLNAELLIIPQCACACLDTWEIRSHNALSANKTILWNDLHTPVRPVHVAQMLFAVSKMGLVLALVSMNTLEIHMKAVALNACSIPIARLIELVFVTSVKILVLEHVGRTLFVKLLITCLSAHVTRATQEIHLNIVHPNLQRVRVYL